MRRMARPSPMKRLLLEMADEAERLAKAARDVANGYPWAYYASLNTTSAETAGSTPGHSTPTENVAMGKANLRREVRRANGAIIRSANQLAQARDWLDDALDARDPHRDLGTRTTPFPRIVTTEDLRLSGEAQARRAARGEGYGEG